MVNPFKKYNRILDFPPITWFQMIRIKWAVNKTNREWKRKEDM